MVNEITPPRANLELLSANSNGKIDSKAVGYIAICITVLGIFAMFNGYSINVGSFSLSPAA